MTNPTASSVPLADLASFARELAACARRETLPRFGEDQGVEDKSAGGRYDPVTDADRAAEAAMRKLIEERFPDHGIRGEELPDKGANGRLAWSLDPIDGTRSFVCGLPTWTTLIALLDKDAPLLGLIDVPCLDETYVGFGDTAFVVRGEDETALRTSACDRLGDARFSTTDPFLLGSEDKSRKIADAVRTTRYGHDGYAYARLAAGSIDLVIETGLKPYDYNAHIALVRAAGGHVGDWNGGSDHAAGDVIAAASRELYDAAVELLAEA